MKAMKIKRGTARAQRRSNMQKFRDEQNARRAKDAAAVTITYNVRASRTPPSERNPHLHDIATVTRLSSGLCSVSTYAATKDYPANVCAPHRVRLYTYPRLMTLGAAKELADRINEPRYR